MNVKTLQEAAQILNINEGTLRVAANRKRLPATKSGGTWLVDLDDEQVQAYKSGLKPKVRNQEMPPCAVCGNPVPRRRAKYCSQTCYAKTFQQ